MKLLKKLTGLLFVAVEYRTLKHVVHNISVSAEEKLKEDKKLRKNNDLIK